MEAIIKMLQEKVGITKSQAEKVIELLKGVFGDIASDVEKTYYKAAQKTEDSEDDAKCAPAKETDTLSDYIDKILRSMFESYGSDSKTKKK